MNALKNQVVLVNLACVMLLYGVNAAIGQDGKLFRLENVRAITDGKISAIAPQWSPGRKKIAFSTNRLSELFVAEMVKMK